MTARLRARPAIALLAIAIGLAGCTAEHEVTERELVNAIGNDDAFEVDGEPFSGKLIVRDGDKVTATIELEDGFPHGVMERFHDNGERMERAEYAWNADKKRAEIDGERVRWNDEGVMVSRTIEDEGVDVRREAWCDDGEPRERTDYKDGERSKHEAWSCKTGKQITAETFDKDGALQGEQKAWSEDGTLVVHSNWVAGQQDGLQQAWHANGKPRSKGTFAKGVPTGKHEAWDEEGRLVEGGSYDAEGRKTGLWLQGSGSQVHYGPDGFIKPELAQAFAKALSPGRPDANAVAFYLDDGQVKATDALPASYNGDLVAGSFNFPVSNWTYPVIVAHESMLKMLVDHGADINQADSAGTTRLLRCADHFTMQARTYGERCGMEQVTAMVGMGAKANVADLKGRNALAFLVDVSKSTDNTIWSRPDQAARQGRVDAVAALANAGADANAADVDGYTPLIRALKARRTDLVRALIAAGARADAAGPEGTSTVHWLFLEDVARYSIEPEFVTETLPLLVQAGADTRAPMDWNDEKVTLRDLAARHAMVDLVRMLDANAKG